MRDAILLGLGRWMIPIPAMIWRRGVRAQAAKARQSLSFMTPDHHRVRDFAVTELFRTATPLEPENVARSLQLSSGRVAELLEDLERHLTFLYRSRGSDVTWAYPVTVDPTAHRGKASTGEEAYSP